MNNAGGGGHVPTKYGADEYFEAAIGLNFRAFYLTRGRPPHACARRRLGGERLLGLLARRDIGSIPYGGAKAALEQMTRMMAMEFAPEIRVNAIRVGAVTTENMRENLLARNPGIGESSKPGRRVRASTAAGHRARGALSVQPRGRLRHRPDPASRRRRPRALGHRDHRTFGTRRERAAENG